HCSRCFGRVSHLVQLRLLRFYMACFFYMGLMRLQYKKSVNRVQLTYYSVTVARMTGLCFLFCEGQVMIWLSIKKAHLESLVFISMLLFQPRSVFEKRVLLINHILRIYARIHRLCKSSIQLNWTIPLVTAMTVYTIWNVVWSIYADNGIFYLLPIIFDGVIFMFCHLTMSAMSWLLKLFKCVNDQIKGIGEKLPRAIQRMDHRKVRRMRRRLICMQKLQHSCRRSTELAFDCLGCQLLCIIYLNLNFLYPLYYDKNHLDIFVCISAYAMREFFNFLDEITTLYSSSHNTLWWQVLNQQVYHFDEALRYHGWADKSLSTWTVEDWSEIGIQDSMHYLLRRKLRILGLFTPDRKFFFHLLLAYSSLVYLASM
ncbi:hypothetical protein KR018_000439, partial [Drosophila ironensis]